MVSAGSSPTRKEEPGPLSGVVFRLGPDGLIVFVSPTVEALTGTSPDHLLGRPPADLPAPLGSAVASLARQAAAQQRPLDASVEWDGHPLLLSLFPEAVGALIGTITPEAPMTSAERTRLEARERDARLDAEASRERYRQLERAIPEIIGRARRLRPGDPRPWRTGAALRWGAALVVLAGVTALRLALEPLIGESVPFLLYPLVLVAATWLGGVRLGVASMIAAVVVIEFLLLPPRFVFAPPGLDDAARYLLFVGEGAILIWGTSRLATALDDRTRLLAREQAARTQSESAERVLRSLAASAERRAREAEEARAVLSALMENIPEGVTVAGGPPNFPIIANSRIAYEIIGRHPEALTGMSAGEHTGAFGLLLPDGRTRPTREQSPLYRATRRGESVRDEEWIVERADGSRLTVLIDVEPVRDSAGRVVGAVKCWRDVSERRRLEAEAARARGELGRILQTMNEAYLRLDADGRIAFMNPAAASAAGADALGRPAAEVFPDLAGTDLERRWHRVLATGAPEEIEHPRPSTGQWLDIRIYPEEGGGVSIFCRDITERRRIEEAVRESDERSRWLIESTTDAVWRFQVREPIPIDLPEDEQIDRCYATGYLAGCNEGMARMYGYARSQDMAGLSLDAIMPRADPVNMEYLRAFIRAGYRLVDAESSERDREGNVKHILNNLVGILRDGALHGAIGTSRDITERKAAEEALRASESRFRELADAMPLIVWSARADGAIDYYNRRWYEFTGLGPGTPPEPWAARVHPEDARRCAASYDQAVRDGRDWECEFRLRDAVGNHRWHLGRAVPVREGGDPVVRWFGTCIDIQQIVEAREELARHRDQLESLIRQRTSEIDESHRRLRVSERLASLGTLSAGLGHDMGNILLPLRVRLDALAARAGPELQDDISAIHASAEYLQRLATGLRLLAADPAGGNPAAGSTDIRAWWSDTAPLLRNALFRTTSLQSHFESDLPPVAVSRAGLAQAVFNLVQNAGDAMRARAGGTVTISASRAGPAAVHLSVSDDGPGMPPDVRERCLEPFFTTKPRSRSTGLGLTLVQGIVRSVGGSVEVESEPGRGTTFTLILPAATTAAAQKSRAVLSIDDARIRGVVAELLRSMSFEVYCGPVEDAPWSDAEGPDLWVADARDGAAAASFLQARPRGRIVLFGPPSPDNPERLIAIGERPSPSVIREALARASTMGLSAPGRQAEPALQSAAGPDHPG